VQIFIQTKAVFILLRTGYDGLKNVTEKDIFACEVARAVVHTVTEAQPH